MLLNQDFGYHPNIVDDRGDDPYLQTTTGTPGDDDDDDLNGNAR